MPDFFRYRYMLYSIVHTVLPQLEAESDLDHADPDHTRNIIELSKSTQKFLSYVEHEQINKCDRKHTLSHCQRSGLVCWCLTTLSAQIGYIVSWAYEIYIYIV